MWRLAWRCKEELTGKRRIEMPLIPMWVKALVVALLLAGLVWGLELWKASLRAEGYSKAQAEFQVQLNQQLVKAAAEREALNRKLKEAENAARIQAEKQALALARANAVAGELRGTIKLYRDSLPRIPLDAARSLADRGLRLLGDCQERYIWMADRAASRASYIRTLKAGWPEGVE